MKILFKNPVFFMQCVLPAILMPIIMGIYMFSLLNGEESIISLKEIGEFNTITACVILGIMHFFSMIIYIAVTAISRDGKNAKFTKYIPVPLYKQIRYKIAPSVLVNLIPIVICAIVSIYLFKEKLIEIIIISIIAIMLSIIESYAMIIVDLKRPKLEWDTEHAVVKQNFNMIFQMLYCAAILGIIVYLSKVLENINVVTALVIILTLSLIPIFIIDKFIKKKQITLFNKIN